MGDFASPLAYERAAPAVAAPTLDGTTERASGRSNSEEVQACGRLRPGASSESARDGMAVALDEILEGQAAAVLAFETAAMAADQPTLPEAAASGLATSMLIGGSIAIASLMGPAAGAAVGGAGIVAQLYRGLASQLAQRAVPAVLGAIRSGSPGDRIPAFCAALRAAILAQHHDLAYALIDATNESDGSECCAILDGLSIAALSAEAVQYRVCVESWASTLANSRPTPDPDGRDRPTELTVDVTLDPHDPLGTAAIAGASCPEIAGLLSPLSGLPARALGVRKTVRGAGFEIRIGADNRVIGVDATAEAREVLRRCGCAPDAQDRAAWASTTGPLGDPYAELHVANGAAILYTTLIANATLSDLGVA